MLSKAPWGDLDVSSVGAAGEQAAVGHSPLPTTRGQDCDWAVSGGSGSYGALFLMQ